MEKPHLNVMICCPMRGLTDEEIEHTIREIQNFMRQHLAEYNVSFWDNMVKYKTVINTNDDYGLYCLGMGLANVMARCDMVVFAPEYDQSRGCLVEYTAASLYNKKIVILTTDESGRISGVKE